MYINQAKKLIKEILKNEDAPPVILYGSPGIGKTRIMEQIAEELNWTIYEIEGKQISRNGVYTINGTVMSLVDITGVPFADKDAKKAYYTRPSIIPDECDEGPGIIFIDDIGNATSSVQAMLYAAVLERRFGVHKIQKGWRIAAATNKESDLTGVTKILPALANRFGLHLEVEADVNDWIEGFAIPQGILPEIIAFHRYMIEKRGINALFDFDPKLSGYAFATPRSWERVDWFLKHGFDSIEVISGAVGPKVASEFKAYLEYIKSMPDVDKILKGEFLYPEDVKIMYALASIIVNKAIKDHSVIPTVVRYCSEIPKKLIEFSVVILKDLWHSSKEISNIIKKCKEFREYANKHRDLFFEEGGG